MNTGLIKTAARLCLVAQLTSVSPGVILPLSAMAAPPSSPSVRGDAQTLVYTLQPGESVSSVAARHGLTVAALKKLNQLRTFSRPFEQLSAGDEIDVPVMKAGPGREPATAAAQDDPAAFWAGTASTAGQMLQGGDTTRAAAGMARSMATGAASTEIEKWLSRAGSARVSLAADEKFSLSEASADALVSLYDTPDWLAFTQLGYRHRDDRHTVNLGAGLRTFRGGWMYGVNAFLDNDLTGRNRRLGLGAEAWTDYLRLSANGYRGLTGWHQSRDLADYDERPADGFDMRMEGWLPAYPQLGGKLMYEQYRGNEVALFGKDERQKDPKAVTAGVSYTPVPLVTLGAEHRQGQGGHSDARFSVGFSWRPGTPWADQVNPAAVGLSRTLASGRYDLVERNNNIVLEYKKQTLIRLSLPETLAGKAGSTDTLTATVTSRYGVSGIDWEYGEVLAAGGRVSEVNKNSLQITYPPYQAAARGAESNVYRISAVARDGQGNASARRTTTITVREPEAAIARGDLAVTRDNAAANGTDANAVQAKVTDAKGNPVPGVKVTFSAGNGAAITAVSDGATDGNGLATATLTNTKAGVTTVSATIGDSSQTVNTTFKADSGTATISAGNLTVTTDNAKANGTATNAVKAIVTDASGNLVSGVAVTFTATNGATITTASATTDADGIATTTLTNTTAGKAKVTATVNGNSQTVDTTFVADGGTATISADNLTATTDNAKANGTATNAVKAIVTDANGNLVSGVAVTFTATNGATITTASATTDADGIATTTLTNTTAGKAKVTATVNGNSQTVDTTFVADGGTATISADNLTVTTDNAKANGTATNAVKAIVTDASGNLVSGVAVTFTATNGATITTASATTDADGIATTTLTNTTAGKAKVTATVNGNSQTVDTTFVADGGTATISADNLTATTDNAKANGTATNAVKAIVTDANGNLVSGVAVTFTATNGATITTASATTDADGIATTTLTNTTAGKAKVTATVNGNSQTVDTTFVADGGTATISADNLTATTDNAKANGTATNAVKAIVTDANGNLVSGVAVTFTATNGATITTASATTDADGIATTTLTNTTAGKAKVTATVNGNSQTVDTTFVADTPDSGRSSLTATPDTITADGTSVSVITLTLKDAQGNLIKDRSDVEFVSSLANSAVSTVTNKADGTYTANLTGTAAGETSVTVTLDGSAFGVAAAKVTLTPPPPVPVPEDTKLAVNGTTFAVENGFPTTGFTRAKFQVLLSGDSSHNGDYTWSADQGWVSVDASGNVSFTGAATSETKKVTITATPKAGGAPLTYTFTVSKWFVNNGRNLMNWGTADEYCSSLGGLPKRTDLTSGQLVRGVGLLWAEWGRLDTAYPDSGFINSYYWTSEFYGAGGHYYVSLHDGSVYHHYDTNLNFVVCRQDL
ncbi:Ig-like domain-containing protein [Enterobacter sp. SLBN-59]|uniref:Ig-like domain-containing protein n=1 Tax=Enterobacter sp. SLBN-59 TaxID=2940621 RepID=UPI0021679ECE|nr:inverse autotransporter beta domain-containing protein [Enterobacter sp. SLBN-59]MCS3490670.1 adhesin/invasin [Enterobacter sp. SLBN-59]